MSRNEEGGHENAIIMLGYYIIILPGCKGKKHIFVEIPGEGEGLFQIQLANFSAARTSMSSVT